MKKAYAYTKWTILGFLIGSFLLLISYTSFASENLFQDPSFEDTTTYWYLSAYGAEQSEHPLTDTYDLDLWSGRFSWGGYWIYYYGNAYQIFYNLPPGEYNVSVWVQATGGSSMTIESCWYDYPEEELGEMMLDSIPIEACPTDSDKWTTIASTTASGAETEWRELSGQFSIEAHDEMYIRFKDTAYNNPKKWHLDDASLTRIDTTHRYHELLGIGLISLIGFLSYKIL